MADAHKTSVAGSLSTTLSEKLKVASAKVGSEFKDLNVAIIKATTSQFHVVPKEKHVRTLKLAVAGSRPRRDVHHVITELHRRLQEATDWLTALKTLVTLHRLMRETEPSFMEELVRYNESLSRSAGGAGAAAAPPRLFCTDNFIDRTTSEGRFDFSEWVRAYGKYLEEQLIVYATLKWYVEQEAPGAESRMRSLGARDLLYQLPHLQRLERRLLDCVPRGAATHDPVVLFSLSLVVKESFKVYKAVSEGVINLADAFFEMDYHDATRGLEFYRESIGASDALCAYYATIEQIDEIKRSMQLPQLSAPPTDFLTSMEAYLEEAPRQLPAEGEAPGPSKKGAPLRKGKLMQSAKRTGSGASVPAAAAAVAASAGPRDPGMVLPLPTGSQTADSGGAARGGSAVSSPTGAGAAAAAGAPAQDLLGDAGEPAAAEPKAEAAGEAAAAAAAPKPAPSPLDLLSDLDFSFSAGGDAAAPAAPQSSNPFADLPVAATALPPQQQYQPAVGSSNPFGEPSPAAAPAPAAFGGGAASFNWPAAPAAGAPQPYGQPQPAAWAQPAQVHQQPYGGAYGAPSPLPAAHSDDPFANFGAPSPASTAPQQRPASGGAFWGPPQPGVAPYGSGPSPPRPIGDEMSKAALHDPFAALTGLPPKSSPGAAAGKPSPPRPGMYAQQPAGFY